MTDEQCKRRDKLGHEFVQECPKYSGYPEHVVTFSAGFDAGLAEGAKEAERLKAENKRYKAAHEHLSNVGKRSIGDIILDRDFWKAESETLIEEIKAAAEMLEEQQGKPFPEEHYLFPKTLMAVVKDHEQARKGRE